MQGRSDEHIARIKQAQEDARKEIDAVTKVLEEEKAVREKAEKELREARECAEGQDQKQSAEMRNLLAKVEALEREKAAAAQEVQEGLQGKRQAGATSETASQEIQIVRAELQMVFEGERQQWEEKMKKQREVSNSLIKRLRADMEAQSGGAAQKRVEELEEERLRLVQENKKLRARAEEAAGLESTLTIYSTALDARVEKAEAKNRALAMEKEELLGRLSGQERDRIELEQRLAEAAMEKEAAAEIFRARLQKEFEGERQRWEEKMKKQKEVTSNLVKQLKADAERQGQSSVAAQKRVEELEEDRVRLVQEIKQLRASGEEAAGMESTLTTYSTALDARVEKAEAKNRALAKEKEELLGKLSGEERDRIDLEQKLAEAAMEKEAAAEIVKAGLQKEFAGERQRWEEKMKKQKEVISNLVKQLKEDAERQLQSSVAAQKRVEELEQERVRLVQESKKLRASGEEAAGMESTLTTFSNALDARVDKEEAKNRALAKEKEELLDKVAKLQKDRIKLEERLAEATAKKEAALGQKEAALKKLSQVESDLAASEGEVNRVRMESASMKEQIIDLEATSTSLAAEKASLSDVLELARTAVEHAEAQVAELNDYAAKLLAEKEVLQTDKLVAAEQNELLVKLEASLKAEKQQLESELLELRVASTGLAEEVEALKQERAIALEQNVLLEKAKEELEAEKQQLKAEVKDHALTQKKVMAQLQALMEEKQVVVEQGTRHAQMMEALEAEKAQLGAELEQLLERMQGPKLNGERESGSKKEAHAALRSVAAKVEELHENVQMALFPSASFLNFGLSHPGNLFKELLENEGGSAFRRLGARIK
jgi:chromosome segregation ATPase